MEKGGLEETWGDVLEVLTQVLPVYDKVNKLISLGKDRKLRREGIQRTLIEGDRVLDAGSGPGVMTEIAITLTQKTSDIILIDPLRIMLDAARRRIGDDKPLILGVFENLPFRNQSFDAVMSGFAIRDARRLSLALQEISRVLKNGGGRFLMVDLGKPDNPISRWAIGIYWRYIVGLMAFLIAGRKGLLFSALFTTYKKLPPNKQLRELLSQTFPKVNFIAKMGGGVVIIRSEK